MHFADRLVERIAALGHPLCVGLDPHLDRIPDSFRHGSMTVGDPATPAAVERFLEAVVDRVAGRVAAVKPQAAFFEQLGPPGLAVMGRVMARARERDLIVILDAKRGDIGSTAAAYARAYLGPDAPLPSDAITANPFLGLETLDPFLDAADPLGRGLFVLVKTSNPGSADLQELDSGGRPVYERLAEALRPRIDGRLGSSGLSSIGIVVGATYPEQARALRAQLPTALALVPGYGAQGASAEDAVAALVRHEGLRTGGVVSASRSILFPAGAWEAGFDEALGRAIDELGAAALR